MDDVKFVADTTQLVAALNAAILKFQDFYEATGITEKELAKVVKTASKVYTELDKQAKVARSGEYAFNNVRKAVDQLNTALARDALENKDVAAALDLVRTKLAQVAQQAGDTKTKVAAAARVKSPELLQSVTPTTQPTPIDQSAVAKYQRNLFRLTGDDISTLGVKAQYTFRDIAKQAAVFATQAGISWEQFSKKLKAVQAGDIKIFKPGAQADLQNVLLGLANQFEILDRTKARSAAQSQALGKAESAAYEEAANKKLNRENALRALQQERLADEAKRAQAATRLAEQENQANLARANAERALQQERRAADAKRISDAAKIAESEKKANLDRANAERSLQQERRQNAAVQKRVNEEAARTLNKQLNAQQAFANYQRQLQSGTLKHKELTTQWDAASKKLVETYVAINNEGQKVVTTVGKQGGVIKEFNQTTYDANKAAQGLLLSWQSLFRMFSTQLLQQALASFVGNLTQAVNAARDLQIQVGLVQTISSSGFNVDRWVNGIKEISDATGLLAKDVAGGLYDTLSNQIADGGKALDFLTNVGRFAVATNSTLKDSVDAVSSAINSYGLTTQDTTRITDVFFKMIDLGRITTQDFANEVGRLYPGASQLGVSLEEVSAVLSSLTRSGVTPAAAMTSLFNVFSRMLKPAGEMKDFFRDIGVESGQAAIQTYGFAQVLAKIAQFAQGRPELLAQLFPDVRGLRGILQLAGTGLKQFQNDLLQMQNAAGTVDAAMNKVADTFGKRFQVELNKVQNYFITVWGQGIVETVVKISDSLGGLVNTVKFTVDAFITAATALTVVVLPRLIAGVNSFTAALAANPIGATIVAATTLYALAKSNLESQIAEIEKLQEQYNETLSREQDRQKTIAEQSTQSIAKATEVQATGLSLILANTTKQYNEYADDIIKKNEEINDSVKESTTAFFNYLGDKVKSFRDIVKDAQTELDKIAKFNLTDPTRVNAKIRGIAIDEADTNEAKYALLEQELIIERASQVAATNREEQLAHYKAIEDILLNMHKIEQDQEKKVIADEKERKKLIQERAKLERELAENEKKQSIAERAQIEKIKTAAKKGPVTTVNGKIQATDNRTALLSERGDLALDKLEGDALAKQKRLIEINIALSKTAQSNIKNQRDLRKELEANLKWQQALDEVNKAIREEEARVAKEREVELENDTKLMRGYISEFEKVKFDKLVDPDTSEDKFKKILESGKSSLEKYAELARKHAGNDFNQRLKLESDLSKARESLASTEEQAKRKRVAKDIEQDIAALKEARKKEQEEAQQKLIRARQPLAVLNTQLSERLQPVQQARESLQNIQTATNLFGMQVFSDEAKKRAADLNQLFDHVTKVMEQIQQGNRDPELFSALRSVANELNTSEFYNLTEFFNKDTALGIIKSITDASQLQGFYSNITQGVTNAERKIEEQTNAIDKLTKDMSAKYGVDLSLLVKNTLETQSIATNTKTSADLLKEINTNLLDFMKGVPANRQAEIIKIPTVPQTKAMGGLMHGKDSIPALLSRGEFVVNAAATRRFYSQLVAMNGVQTFSRGGLVNNVGDINVSMQSTGGTQSDIVAIGKGIQREIRRGRLKLS